ncbi:hypothetical protein ABID19_004384 [Mesorhizobium robiniae]|uniref:Uncharacterized protein n=1 Tax=Mesorhizobium robiniae TaxID=559315 RepID=A0ABV2GSR3_9HYPH
MNDARFLAAARSIREARLRRAEERASRSHAAHKEAEHDVAEAVGAIDDHRKRTAAAERMAMNAMLGQRLSAASMQDLENSYLAAQFEMAGLAEAKHAAERRAHARWIELMEATNRLRHARLARDKIDALAAEMSARGAIREAALTELVAEEDYKPAGCPATPC